MWAGGANSDPFRSRAPGGEEQGGEPPLATVAERGRLKIFLGYGPGVGKSARMFKEGRRRARRGQDVVIAAARDEDDAAGLTRELEKIAPLVAAGGSALNVPALLARRPGVCLVDGLAYGNPPGWERRHRVEDVAELLARGISVLATLGLQYVSEKRAEVERITGRAAPAAEDAVPESFLRAAEEIEVVDAPPEAASAGAGSGPEAGIRQLAELREMALLLAASVVDAQLEAYLRRHHLEPMWGARERVLVCLSAGANPAAMLASGRRNADRFDGELIAAHVSSGEDRPDDLRRNLELARAARAEVVVLEGEFPEAVLEFARERGVTQIFAGHSARRGWPRRLFGGALDQLVRRAEGMDVRIFPEAR